MSAANTIPQNNFSKSLFLSLTVSLSMTEFSHYNKLESRCLCERRQMGLLQKLSTDYKLFCNIVLINEMTTHEEINAQNKTVTWFYKTIYFLTWNVTKRETYAPFWDTTAFLLIQQLVISILYRSLNHPQSTSIRSIDDLHMSNRKSIITFLH